MNRRESIKSILVGSMAGGLAVTSCMPSESTLEAGADHANAAYGRTDKEKAHDEKVRAEIFFTDHELDTIAALCDIILPSDDANGGASDAGVLDFMKFIINDMPKHQLKLRGGMMWLDGFSNAKFALNFASITEEQKRSICDLIAYPSEEDSLQPGILFFSRMRDLILTGYYTSPIGIKALGYKGNTPNVWDGVPQNVLDRHGMAYEKEWLAKCVDQSARSTKAEWDDNMNLIT